MLNINPNLLASTKLLNNLFILLINEKDKLYQLNSLLDVIWGIKHFSSCIVFYYVQRPTREYV
jgi:hypothetical protein